MKEYKVWIEIEEVTDKDLPTEKFETLDVGFASTATFDTYDDAYTFAERMHKAAGNIG